MIAAAAEAPSQPTSTPAPSRQPAPEDRVARFESLLRDKAKGESRNRGETDAKREPQGEAAAANTANASLRQQRGMSDERGDKGDAYAALTPAADKAAAPPQVAPVASDSAAIQSQFEEAMLQAQRLDFAHARPAATQLLMPGADAALAQALLTRTDAGAPLNISLVPGQIGMTANALDELRRRLAAKGVALGEVRFTDSADVPAS